MAHVKGEIREGQEKQDKILKKLFTCLLKGQDSSGYKVTYEPLTGYILTCSAPHFFFSCKAKVVTGPLLQA